MVNKPHCRGSDSERTDVLSSQPTSTKGLFMTDEMVLRTQKWLNANYRHYSSFGSVAESGHTGWDTIWALTRALQIELGITQTADNFGPSTQRLFMNRWPSGIHAQADKDESESNVYAIIQGALWCKGYSTGASDITRHFYGGTKAGIEEMQRDMNISADGIVTLEVMKSLLSMDQFKLVNQTDQGTKLRTIQQHVNAHYRRYTGIIPCDGVYGRQMNTGLIQVLQSLEGYSPDDATGYFGNGTKAHLIKVSAANAEEYPEFFWLAKAMLVCNGYSLALDGHAWNSEVFSVLLQFQKDYQIAQTGVFDTDTWMSLFVSTGNPDRQGKACDCATILDDEKAQLLAHSGYTHVGRYLTGFVWNAALQKQVSKALTPEETSSLMVAGLSVFPIYQDGGEDKSHFVESQGYKDAQRAIQAALRFGFPKGTVIYFAVDSDMYEYEINSFVARYFREIRLFFNSNSNPRKYRVGVYGTRLLCTRMHELGYTDLSFVGDLSTGFAGNLGYPLPKNWAFDQFRELSASQDEFAFDLDRDAYSGRDKGTQEFFPMPYVRVPDASQDTADTLRQEYVQKFFDALGMGNKFLGAEWTMGAQFPIMTIPAPGIKLDIYGEISDTVSHEGIFEKSFSVQKDLSSGKISRETKDQITAEVSQLGITGTYSSEKLISTLDEVAMAVPEGDLSYSISVGAGYANIAVTVDLLPSEDKSSVSMQTSLSVIFKFTFSGFTFNFEKVTQELLRPNPVALIVVATMLTGVRKFVENLHLPEADIQKLNPIGETAPFMLVMLGAGLLAFA